MKMYILNKMIGLSIAINTIGVDNLSVALLILMKLA